MNFPRLIYQYNYRQENIVKMQDKFSVWCEADIFKAIDPVTGEVTMKMGGIASTSAKDSDGEYLDPNGFDVKPLLEKGLVNWHHRAKDQPQAIIGEPTTAKITPEGLYIEAKLYPSSPLANEVYCLAETLEKDSSTRRLGFSIEGRVLKRRSNKKTSPLYNMVDKAEITGVAITHQPKNPKTLASIIKGETDNSEEYSESENAYTKTEVMDWLFSKADISVELAEKIYCKILNLSQMAERKFITEDDLTKASEALGLDADDDQEEQETVKEKVEKKNPKLQKSKKPDGGQKKTLKAKETDEDDDEPIEDDDETDETDVEETKKAMTEMFEKGFQDVTNLVKAVGVLVEDCRNKLDAAESGHEELLDIIKAQGDEILDLKCDLELLGNVAPAPKSLQNTAPVQKVFNKAGDNEDFEKSSNTRQLNIKNKDDRNTVLSALDELTFQKGGYNKDFGDATTLLEGSKVMTLPMRKLFLEKTGIEVIG